jgi:hypothetical protein
MASDSRKGVDRFRERHPERWKVIQKRSREKHKGRRYTQNDKWRRTSSGRVSLLLTSARRRAKDLPVTWNPTFLREREDGA